MHIRKYFKTTVREPYMGNGVDLKIMVKVDGNGEVTVRVVNPEKIPYEAKEISFDLFNE